MKRLWQADSPRGLIAGSQASGAAAIAWPMLARAQKETRLPLVAVLYPVLFTKMPLVMPRILAMGKPTLGVYPEWGRAGLLLTYSNNAMDGFRRAGAYAAKIIQGTKPGDLPIEQASKFWLVVNLKTAGQLGIKAPSNLLALADEVIE